MPTLARWPGKIPAGSVCDAVAGTIDLLPTLVTLSGGKGPEEPVIDGRDISPLLLGKSTTSPREAHYYFAGYNLQAVRQGPWKLAITSQPQAQGEADASEIPRLYNLDEEIGEKTNLAKQHPDVVARLQSLAMKMNAEIGGNSSTARRPAGTVDNPKTLYPSEPNAPRATRKKNAGPFKPVMLESPKGGEVLSGEKAPQVGGRPFTLSCDLQTDQSNAVIVAHGGSAVGYAVYLKDGRVVFTIRDRGQETAP